MVTFFPTLKSREEPTSPLKYFYQRASVSQPWVQRPPYQGWIEEEIISQCHTGMWPPPLDSERDIGGEMALKRTVTDYLTAPINAQLTKGEVRLGRLIGYTDGIGTVDQASQLDLNTFGTSAISRVLPTNPSSSLSTALGELKKDGLPSLPGSSMRDRTDLARSSGNEYLNIEFGWLPLLRDAQDFARTVKRARALIDQYRRDSDRKIRRRFEPAELLLGTSVHYGTGEVSGNNVRAPGSSLTRRDTIRYWFSGAFKYHIPVGDDLYSRLLRYESYANRLFGTRITPEVLWNLAPWSWAVDWFTNAGDVIHNISQLGPDGLVMQYGYSMRHAVTHEHHKGRYVKVDPFGTHTGDLERIVLTEYKKRVRAHPYGFGITDTSLNARQAAILAALGLTRGQRTP